MFNSKKLAFVVIGLLILQIFLPNIAMISASEATETNPATVAVNVKSANDTQIIWEVVINPQEVEIAAAKTTIAFGDGLTHEAIHHGNDVTVSATDRGYIVTTDAGSKAYTLDVVTNITKTEQSEFTLTANLQVNGTTFSTVESFKREVAKEERKQEEGDEQEKVTQKQLEEENDDAKTVAESKENDESSELLENNGIIDPPFQTTAFPNALPGLMSSDEWPKPGSLKLTKNAKDTGRFAEWEIELTIEGKNLKTSSDVVLVLDSSGSMSGIRIAKLKTAAKQFVDNLLPNAQSTVRIALVSFASTAIKESDFRGYSGRTSLKNQIDSLSAGGGTNIQAGLRQAAALLNNSTADRKTIVVLSDGEPTYSYRANRATRYTWPGNKYQFILSNFTNTRIGTGNNYNLSTRYVDFSYRVNGYHVTTNGIGTLSEAKHLMDQGYDIYSIGLDVGNNQDARYVLQNIQNKGYYAGGSDDLTPIFNQIAANLIYPATNAVVTDPLGEMFTLVKDGSYSGNHFSASHGTVSWNEATKTFTWNIGNVSEGQVYKLRYKIVLDCTKNPRANQKYKTNKTTTLNYKDYNGKQSVKNFPIPEVSINKGKITKIGYRVNIDGQPIDERGNVVSIAEAQRFYEELYGENLVLNKTYSVPAGNTPNGYQLYVGDDPTQVFLQQICHVVPFGYIKTSELPKGKVIVKHVDEAGNELAPSEQLEGSIGEAYVATPKEIAGYEYWKLQEGSAPATGTFKHQKQTVIFVYKQQKGKIKIIKIDAEDPAKKLKGARFAIKNHHNEIVAELETNEFGTAISGDLPVGEYTLQEIKVPYGYQLVPNQNLKVTVKAKQTKEITIKNKRLKGELKIIKVDANNHEQRLEGAIFELQDLNGNKLFEATTDENGVIRFTNVAIGKYQLVETKAPAGYRLNNQPITVEITPEQLKVTKKIENSEQTWEIPVTGGIGALGLIGAGLLLMSTSGWLFLRYRKESE